MRPSAYRPAKTDNPQPIAPCQYRKRLDKSSNVDRAGGPGGGLTSRAGAERPRPGHHPKEDAMHIPAIPGIPSAYLPEPAQVPPFVTTAEDLRRWCVCFALTRQHVGYDSPTSPARCTPRTFRRTRPPPHNRANFQKNSGNSPTPHPQPSDRIGPATATLSRRRRRASHALPNPADLAVPSTPLVAPASGARSRPPRRCGSLTRAPGRAVLRRARAPHPHRRIADRSGRRPEHALERRAGIRGSSRRGRGARSRALVLGQNARLRCRELGIGQGTAPMQLR